MIRALELGERELASPLGRIGPLAKLTVAVGWLVGLALTIDPRPPLVIAAAALAGGIVLGRVGAARFLRRLAPLLLAAAGIGLFNAVAASAGAPPGLVALRLGPLALTEPGIVAGLGLGLRVLAIASVAVAFVLTTDATRLVDALVQVARLPERFAYGALAAYQALPRLAEAFLTLQQARRIRGLRASWHPGVLVGLLVLAVRHADRLALAMDARAFGAGPRSRYRIERWRAADSLFVAATAGLLVVALASASV